MVEWSGIFVQSGNVEWRGVELSCASPPERAGLVLVVVVVVVVLLLVLLFIVYVMLIVGSYSGIPQGNSTLSMCIPIPIPIRIIQVL